MFFEAISASLLVLIVNLIDLFTVSVAILVDGATTAKLGSRYREVFGAIGDKQLTIIPRVRKGSESIAHEFSEIA